MENRGRQDSSRKGSPDKSRGEISLNNKQLINAEGELSKSDESQQMDPSMLEENAKNIEKEVQGGSGGQGPRSDEEEQEYTSTNPKQDSAGAPISHLDTSKNQTSNPRSKSNIVSASLLTPKKLENLMDDFFIRNKLVRDTISQMCLIVIGFYIKYKKLERIIQRKARVNTHTTSEVGDTSRREFSNEQGGGSWGTERDSKVDQSSFGERSDDELVIGVLGAGLIGRIFIEFLHNKVLFGKKIEVRVSTRVPEKLFGQKFEGMRIFYDNAKLVRESDIILLCTPKHKSRTVFKSIQPQVKELFKKGIKKFFISVIGNMLPEKLGQMIGLGYGISTGFQVRLDYKYMEEEIFSEILEMKQNGELIDLSLFTKQLVLKSMTPLLEDFVFALTCLSGEYHPEKEPESINPTRHYKDWEEMFKIHFMKKNTEEDGGVNAKTERSRISTERKIEQLRKSKVLRMVFDIDSGELDKAQFKESVITMLSEIGEQLASMYHRTKK